MGWLTGLSLAMTVGGAVTSAVGTKKRANAEEKAAQAQGDAEQRAGLAAQRSSEAQAALALYNAQVAELQAKDAVLRGEQEAQQFRKRTSLLIGEQRAGFAAANVDVGYGSVVDVQADAAFLGELDALTVRTNAAREAWGFQVEAEDLRARSEILKMEGANAAEAGRYAKEAAYETGRAIRTGGTFGAATTLLSAGGSLLESRYGFGRRGKR